ncbi:branched-chain amino acid ABC transporter permease [Rubellimicrobium rubrum]|uniref:Branched-chain amino acid ABC transporter permease n=1 Tax=Rubellimicrobium rubrum TaxID=2585369 RepID=A0A5C4N2B6_9RHOB|nr:AzlC family ABC transporter permease [Rubellimicrobium rubrum]TNC51524.1 branched-chain amino acid ABC transporter permease [Rubellimicrobium rubrum]
MSSSTSPLARGIRDGLPFLVALTPFGLLFGVAAAEAGLGLGKALAFSVAVIAGASQFTALSMMRDGAPVLIVLATALAVNLRMAMYSASLAPHLGGLPLWQRALAAYCLVDATYAASIAVYEREPGWTLRDKLAYFAGVCLPVCPTWFLLTVMGAMLGRSVPDWMALDFAVPICFLAMVAPGLRTLAHLLAALTSVALALLLAWMPYSSGLLVAALAAMAVGAETDRRMAG